MPDTCKLIELVGVSEESVHQAIRNAVARAARGFKGLDWFEVTEVPGLVREGQVSEFQVKLKVGFRIFSDDECGEPERAGDVSAGAACGDAFEPGRSPSLTRTLLGPNHASLSVPIRKLTYRSMPRKLRIITRINRSFVRVAGWKRA